MSNTDNIKTKENKFINLIFIYLYDITTPSETKPAFDVFFLRIKNKVTPYTRIIAASFLVVLCSLSHQPSNNSLHSLLHAPWLRGIIEISSLKINPDTNLSRP